MLPEHSQATQFFFLGDAGLLGLAAQPVASRHQVEVGGGLLVVNEMAAHVVAGEWRLQKKLHGIGGGLQSFLGGHVGVAMILFDDSLKTQSGQSKSERKQRTRSQRQGGSQGDHLTGQGDGLIHQVAFEADGGSILLVDHVLAPLARLARLEGACSRLRTNCTAWDQPVRVYRAEG